MGLACGSLQAADYRPSLRVGRWSGHGTPGGRQHPRRPGSREALLRGSQPVLTEAGRAAGGPGALRLHCRAHACAHGCWGFSRWTWGSEAALWGSGPILAARGRSPPLAGSVSPAPMGEARSLEQTYRAWIPGFFLLVGACRPLRPSRSDGMRTTWRRPRFWTRPHPALSLQPGRCPGTEQGPRPGAWVLLHVRWSACSAPAGSRSGGHADW